MLVLVQLGLVHTREKKYYQQNHIHFSGFETFVGITTGNAAWPPARHRRRQKGVLNAELGGEKMESHHSEKSLSLDDSTASTQYIQCSSIEYSAQALGTCE